MANRRTTKMIEIDGGKLLSQIDKKTKLPLDTISVRLGYGHSYISNCINRGQISPQAAVSIESIFGIKLDTYEKRQQVAEPTNETPPAKQPIEISYSRLEDIIYRAVKRALEEG